MKRSTIARGSSALAATVAACAVLVSCGGNPARSASSAAPVSGAASQRHAAVPTSSLPPKAVGSSAPAARSSSQGPGIPALPGGIAGPVHDDPVAPVSSPPVRVRIPAIGVDSSLQALGLEKGGVLETPSQWQVAGWYADGVRPGDDGPAVIAGHVDSVNGPAVFFRLKQLQKGDKVYVTRKNGSTLTFTVASTAEYPKRTFPTEAVYGPSPLPTLRLVTCTGDFDYSKRSYVDNLVVTAYAD